VEAFLFRRVKTENRLRKGFKLLPAFAVQDGEIAEVGTDFANLRYNFQLKSGWRRSDTVFTGLHAGMAEMQEQDHGSSATLCCN
jgi:hypothetical protein